MGIKEGRPFGLGRVHPDAKLRDPRRVELLDFGWCLEQSYGLSCIPSLLSVHSSPSPYPPLARDRRARTPHIPAPRPHPPPATISSLTPIPIAYLRPRRHTMTSPPTSYFLPYPQEYFFAHNLAFMPHSSSSVHSSQGAIELPMGMPPPQSSIGFSPQMASLALLQHHGQHQYPPGSPLGHQGYPGYPSQQQMQREVQHASIQPLPPSPLLNSSNSNSSPSERERRDSTTPSSVAASSSSTPREGREQVREQQQQGSAEMKMLRHVLGAVMKMQECIREVGEKQGEIRDSLSLLEQRGSSPLSLSLFYTDD